MAAEKFRSNASAQPERVDQLPANKREYTRKKRMNRSPPKGGSASK
jgi:hypothetical protein